MSSHPQAVYVLVAKQPLTADLAATFPWSDTEVIVLAAADMETVLREDVESAVRVCHAPGSEWRKWIEADGAGRGLEVVTNDEYCLEVNLTAQAEIEAHAVEAHAMRRPHVERARHRAELARRRP